jgi:hypothetical protein
MNAVTTTTAAATNSTSGVILQSQSTADPTENGSIEIPNLIMTFIEEVNILEIIYFLIGVWCE